MANSLIELYGGGMAGKSNNYQLGGRIASARRDRDYQGEMRELRKKQEEANRRKKQAGLRGSIGSMVGGLIGAALAPVTGGASLALATGLGAGLGRAAGESTYEREDFGGGKYAQDTRGELGRGEDDYRRSIGERALMTGLQSAIMPGIFEKGAGWLKGLHPGATPAGFIPVSELEAATTAAQSAATSVAPAAAVSSVIPDATSVATTPPVDLSAYTGTAAQNLDLAREMGLDLSGGQTVRGAYESMTGNPWSTAGDMYSSYFPATDTPTQFAGFRGGGLIGMTVPQYGNGGPMERGSEYNSPIGNTDDSAQQAWFGNNPNVRNQLNQLNPSGGFGVNLGWSDYREGFNPFGQYSKGFNPQVGSGGTFNPNAGYGTATDARGALMQMGMGDIVNDPRFAAYAADLPDFQMGYAQQIGDYRTGAQEGLLGLAQSGASGAGGFAGSGAATTQAQQQRQQMVDQFGRQKRGVIEGYQADVLSGIRDIEQKGEFEFGQPEEKTYGGGMLGQMMQRLANRQQTQFTPQQTQDASQKMNEILQRMQSIAGTTG